MPRPRGADKQRGDVFSDDARTPDRPSSACEPAARTAYRCRARETQATVVAPRAPEGCAVLVGDTDESESGRAVRAGLGTTDVAVSSAGEKIASRRPDRYPRDLIRDRRRTTRTPRGPNSRREARNTVARADFRHHTATHPVRDDELIAVEDLNVPGTPASARGTASRPGRDAHAEAGPERRIMNAALGEVRRHRETANPGTRSSAGGRPLVPVRQDLLHMRTPAIRTDAARPAVVSRPRQPGTTVPVKLVPARTGPPFRGRRRSRNDPARSGQESPAYR